MLVFNVVEDGLHRIRINFEFYVLPQLIRILSTSAANHKADSSLGGVLSDVNDPLHGAKAVLDNFSSINGGRNSRNTPLVQAEKRQRRTELAFLLFSLENVVAMLQRGGMRADKWIKMLYQVKIADTISRS